MSDEIIHALFYGFLGALGILLLNAASVSDILSAYRIGSFLVIYGILIALFMIFEEYSRDTEYQEIITLIIILIATGLIIRSYGLDPLKIIGAVLLSISLGRAIALMLNF